MANPRDESKDRKLLPLNVPERREKRKEPRNEASLAQGHALRQWVFLVSAIAAFLFLLHLYVRQFVEIKRLERNRDEVSATLKREQARMAKVGEEVRFLRTLEGVERLARERLKYIKRDEVVIKPVKPGGSPATGEAR